MNLFSTSMTAKKGTLFASSLSREESAVGNAKALIASCLWIAVFWSPAWAGGPVEALLSGVHVLPLDEPSHPYPFYLTEEPGRSRQMDLKDLFCARPALFSPAATDETDRAFQGLRARYEIGVGNYSVEFSGGYLPEMKSLIPSKAAPDPRSHLGYVNLEIPLYRFYLKGGAFFGQQVEALGLRFEGTYGAQNAERELFGYQIGGRKRFGDSLSIQAGWGQVAQEYETAKEGLKVWYVHAHISLGWRMFFAPHEGYIDFTSGDGEKVKEEAFYCGARWQINF
jgi:hypothetical protein